MEDARAIHNSIEKFLADGRHREHSELRDFPKSIESIPWRRAYAQSPVSTAGGTGPERWMPSDLSSGVWSMWLFTNLPRGGKAGKGNIIRKTDDGGTWNNLTGRILKQGYPETLKVNKLVLTNGASAFDMIELTRKEHDKPTVALCKISRKKAQGRVPQPADHSDSSHVRPSSYQQKPGSQVHIYTHKSQPSIPRTDRAREEHGVDLSDVQRSQKMELDQPQEGPAAADPSSDGAYDDDTSRDNLEQAMEDVLAQFKNRDVLAQFKNMLCSDPKRKENIYRLIEYLNTLLENSADHIDHPPKRKRQLSFETNPMPDHSLHSAGQLERASITEHRNTSRVEKIKPSLLSQEDIVILDHTERMLDTEKYSLNEQLDPLRLTNYEQILVQLIQVHDHPDSQQTERMELDQLQEVEVSDVFLQGEMSQSEATLRNRLVAVMKYLDFDEDDMSFVLHGT